jgi:hypothetical protein
VAIFNDGVSLQQKTPFSFNIKVINKAPVFLAKLEELSVKVGRTVRYVIPDVVDEYPEGVSLTIVYQGLTKLPSFATFDPKSRTLIFSPLSGQQTSGTFKF